MGTSSFEDLPQELLLESFALYCDVQHKITVSKLNRRLQFLFKEPVLHQQLLELTAKYKKNIPPLADQIKKAAVEKPRVTNPILKQIDTLLDQNPILALKPGQFSDGSGHFFCCSTLVYACWSLNWVVYEMIYRALRAIPNSHACTAALTEAKRQEIALARKAFDYDLYLWSYQWRATIPVLPRIPMLLKWIEGRPNNRYLQWGDHNGTWSFRTLLPTEAPLFNHLLFPPPEEAPLTIKSAHITTEMYTILSKGHTVARYDLSEYRENTENFIGNDESIEIVEHFPTFFREHVNHLDPWQNQLWNKIGVAQQNFPAWIVQLWVGDFNYRIENVEDAIIKSRSSSLHLKDHYPHPEFYNMKLGDNKFNKVYLNQPNTTYSLYLVKYSGSGIEYRRSRYQWECLLNPDKMRILEEVTKIKFMPLADLITQIDQVPSEAHRESTQLTAENGLNVNSVQEVIKSYKHYKNRYFGLAWLSTSIGTLTIIQRLQQASDNEERYKLAEEYLAHNSDRNGNASTKFAEVLQRKMGR